MRSLKKIFVAAACLLVPWISGAQNPMSLEECVRVGLENNYGIRIVRNQQRIAENNATRANAGQLPSLDLGATFSGTYYDYDYDYPEGVTSSNTRNYYTDLGLTLGWTIFDGFNMSANYRKLNELKGIGELNTRMALEDFVASLAAEYYSLIRQQVRLSNLKALVRLSRERLRITEESFNIGAASGLDFQQAQVDYNADNSSLISQLETVQKIQINLNRMMGLPEVDRPVNVADSVITPNVLLQRDVLWENTMDNNTSLLIAQKNRTVSELDLKKAQSRNYPYLRVSAGYGYRHSWDNYSNYANSDRLGFNYGISAGMTIFDGNRRREQRNARIEIENRQLHIDQLELGLKSDMASLWLAYTNNLKLWDLERENLVVARNNFEIAMERYRLRELSGIELREAQLSLLQSEERLSTVEYNIKLCEVSLHLLSGGILNVVNE